MKHSGISNTSSGLSAQNEPQANKYPQFTEPMWQQEALKSDERPSVKEGRTSPGYKSTYKDRAALEGVPVSHIDTEDLAFSYKTQNNQSKQPSQMKKDQSVEESKLGFKYQNLKKEMKYDDIALATSLTIPQNSFTESEPRMVGKSSVRDRAENKIIERENNYDILTEDVEAERASDSYSSHSRNQESGPNNYYKGNSSGKKVELVTNLDDDDMDISFRTPNQSVQLSQARKDQFGKESRIDNKYGDIKGDMSYHDIALAVSTTVSQKPLLNQGNGQSRVFGQSSAKERVENRIGEAENNYDLLIEEVEAEQVSDTSLRNKEDSKEPEITELLDTVKPMLTEPSSFNDSFVDEKTLYHIHDLMASSRHRGVQTDKKVRKEQRPEFLLSNVGIKILEVNRVKEGTFSAAYNTYRIQTVLKNEGQGEFTVTRRYRDFDWLFEHLSTKYQGYIIPILPPKSLKTDFESNEFHEDRKKNLVRFLEKCMQHPFLRSTEELDLFLTDQNGFNGLKDKKDDGYFSWLNSDLLSNIFNKVQSIARGEQAIFRELTSTDSELINHGVMFANLMMRLDAFSKDMTLFLNSKIQGIKTNSSFALGLENIRAKKEDIQENKTQTRSLYAKNADAQKGYVVDMLEKTETDLKDIISNVESVNVALRRRNDHIKELHRLQQIVEARSIKAKKSLTSNQKLDELKSECDIWKEDLQSTSKTLLEEINSQKESITEQLKQFSQDIGRLNKKCLHQALTLWEDKKL